MFYGGQPDDVERMMRAAGKVRSAYVDPSPPAFAYVVEAIDVPPEPIDSIAIYSALEKRGWEEVHQSSDRKGYESAFLMSKSPQTGGIASFDKDPKRCQVTYTRQPRPLERFLHRLETMVHLPD